MPRPGPLRSPAMLPARLPPERVRATYTWIAPTHDLMAYLVDRRARALSLAWAAVRDGERVLEVGVGTGLTFRPLLDRNPHGYTVGVDLTPAMLRHARRRAARSATDRYALRPGDARELDLPDASFDCLLCSYMFDLLPETDFLPVLQEFGRVLRPGGRLVLTNMTQPRRGYERVWELLYRLWPPLLGGCRPVYTVPYLRAAGFTRVRRAHVTQAAFPSEVVYGVR